jgi:phosphatidylglycerol:prolipoprotein diacylglycerol transferase
MTAILLLGYGCARYLVEFAREPDSHLGLFFGVISMGQILCLPMIAAGLYLMFRGRNGKPA